MSLLAYIAILFWFLSATSAPGNQGKAEIKTSGHTVMAIWDFLIVLALCGRVLGWW
ncbi:MAG: hypothetical protein KGZ65_04080 [Sphingomonadales bacterium]|nr:hypothetical protein [Sphingomonadales bacterium]